MPAKMYLSPSPWVRWTPSTLKLVGEQSKLGMIRIRSGHFRKAEANEASIKAKFVLYQYGWHRCKGGSTKI